MFMIYKANIERKIALYGTYSEDKPYPKNCPIKKEKNKRLYHLTKLVINKSSLNDENAVTAILSI